QGLTHAFDDGFGDVRLRDKIAHAALHHIRFDFGIEIAARQNHFDLWVAFFERQIHRPAAQLGQSHVAEHQIDVALVTAVNVDRLDAVLGHEHTESRILKNFLEQIKHGQLVFDDENHLSGVRHRFTPEIGFHSSGGSSRACGKSPAHRVSAKSALAERLPAYGEEHAWNLHHRRYRRENECGRQLVPCDVVG